MITSGVKYKELIERCALRPLASEEDLDAALDMQLELMNRLNSLEEEEKDYLKVLGNLIEAYEAVHHNLDDIPDGTPAEMLRWLMQINGMKQVDLCELLHITSGRASEIANGIRDMSKSQILILAQRFNVNPGMFLSKTPIPVPWRNKSEATRKKSATRSTGGRSKTTRKAAKKPAEEC